MSITDIPSTVERIWNFIIPPLVELVILIVVTTFLAGYTPIINALMARLHTLRILGDPELIRILEAYGVTKIAPLILLFLLFFGSHAIHKLAYIIGGIVPIHVGWNWYGALSRVAMPYHIAEIWQYYPRVSNVADLDRVIDEKVDSVTIEGGKSVFRDAIAHRMRFSKVHSYLLFIKFLLIWGLAVSIFLIVNGVTLIVILPRLLVLIFVLVVAFVLLVKKLESLMEFYSSAKIRGFITWLQGSAEPQANPDKERRRELEKEAENQLQSPKPLSTYFILAKSLSSQRKASEHQQQLKKLKRDRFTNKDAA